MEKKKKRNCIEAIAPHNRPGSRWFVEQQHGAFKNLVTEQGAGLMRKEPAVPV